LAALLAACARVPEPREKPPAAISLAALPPDTLANARIERTWPKLECVAYARRESGIQLFGDAWSWWEQAPGRYVRGAAPQPGAVLVFHRYRGSRGHVAVVRTVINGRVIVVDHADWLNDGNIHRSTPVTDVSQAGDWSAVRVFYSPGGVWGARAYTTYGFIYPDPRVAIPFGAPSSEADVAMARTD
jgi:hypothetical protein